MPIKGHMLGVGYAVKKKKKTRTFLLEMKTIPSRHRTTFSRPNNAVWTSCARWIR